MFLEEIELVGYERFKLNSFNRLHIKFTKKIQSILGTNGSGKSSLMEELSPLPAESKHYSKDGRKTVIYRHHGKRYTLVSSFNPQNHSFKIEGDDTEFNPGGTITEQRALVKKHFGIDNKTHALAIGKHNFHSMSADARKEWFRLLSDVNYDYAINTFKRIKDAFRDVTGALKLARNKLVSQSSKRMPKEDLEALKRECEELHSVVQFMIENRNSPTRPIEDSQKDIDDNLQRLQEYSLMIIDTVKELDSYLSNPIIQSELTDLRDASSLSFFINNKLNELKAKRVELFKDYRKCQEALELYEKTKLFQVANISKELEELKSRRDKIVSSLAYGFETNTPHEFLENMEIIAPRLLELSLEIPINTGSTKYTREGYKVMVETKQETLRSIDVLKANIENFKESLNHHKQHKDEPSLTCPKCNHHWNPKFNKGIVKDIEDKMEKAGKDIKDKELIVQDLDIQIQEFDKWVQHIEAIKDLSHEFGFMKDFWSLIMKKEILFENPRNVAQIITSYKTDLFNERALLDLNKRISAELEKLDMTEHTQGFDAQEATITLQHISKELDLIANEEIRLNSIKDAANGILRGMRRLEGSEKEIQEMESYLKTMVNDTIEDHLRTIFNQILRSFHSDLAIKEKAINDEILHESTLKMLKDEISSLEEQSEAYKIVLRELSPTEGIIAEGLYGFMKLFIRRMNKFIATVWSYPLVVQPCSSEEGKIELNYKFPLLVNTGEKPRNDVSDGSSSMREIVDLGFVICSLKSLGLSDYSLFLDEFGSSMDPVHKSKTSNMIADIVENEKFEQIFIISHDVVQYSSLDHGEVCILNAANVIIPNGCVYNQHVTFE